MENKFLNTNNDSEKNHFDVADFLSIVIAKWQIIIVLMIFLGIVGYAVGKVTYYKFYSSSATFVVSSNISSSTTVANKVNNSEIDEKLINTFRYILLSDEGVDSVVKEIAKDFPDVSSADIKNSVSVSSVKDTNVLIMTVTTLDKKMSFLVARELLKKYPDVLNRTLKQSAYLEVLNEPREPDMPNPYYSHIIYSILGALVGLFAGIVLTILIETLRNTVKKAEEISNKIDLPVMASVPLVNKQKGIPEVLITHKNMGFAFVETYKSLRTKIENVSLKKNFKTFLVSSAIENEGKTTVLTNTAIALAQNGKRVLVIDADLRRPAVAKILGIKDLMNENQLSAYLKGEETIENIIKYLPDFNISTICAGKSVSGSSELLSSAKMKNLIESVYDHFDYILIDSAPVSLVTDAEIICSFVDAAIMVVRYDFANIFDIGIASEALTAYKAELVGCVFNAVDFSSISYTLKYSNRYKYKYKGKNYTYYDYRR